jgi:protein involved in polysaccharide export with SLBB domain
VKRNRRKTYLLFLLFAYNLLHSQVTDFSTGPRDKDETQIEPMDFSSYLKPYQSDNDDFETWKRQRDLKMNQKSVQMQSLEKPIESEAYLIGPGDTFSLNIWGAMEQHISVIVSPEGRLIIPTVGEIECVGETLKNIQKIVIEKASNFYKNCQLSFPLITPRTFMVHVTGEVKYPGSYQANAGTRVSEILMLAGGVSKLAWKQRLQIRHIDFSVDTSNIDAFEAFGDTRQNPFLSGGDVVFVPAMDPSSLFLVRVEGNVELAGVYQIIPDENLKDFLVRIRGFNTQIGLNYIKLIRKQLVDNLPQEETLTPFFKSDGGDFKLKPEDRIILPLSYVFVKGSVTNPGPYAFANNLRAKDYATMARWNGSIDRVKVLHFENGRKEKGADIIVQPGDIVDVPKTWAQMFTASFGIVTTLTSLILTAVAIGAL